MTDSTGNVVTLFRSAAPTRGQPNPGRPRGGSGDLGQIAVAVLDLDAGTFVGLDATLVEDGSVAFLVVRLTPVPAPLMADDTEQLP